ncbi:MAG: hypothetical protein WBN96_04925, partial [Gammaproteobacteria bacterium]
NTGVIIRGNQTGVTDVSVLATGDFFLQAGTGANSSVSIESTDADAEGVSVDATNITIANTGAGTDSDAFINASNGATNASLLFSGICTGCVAVTNPAATAGSQFGVWAANFTASGAVFFDNTSGSFLWDDPLNWNTDLLPDSTKDVTISFGGTISLASGNHTIGSLTGSDNLNISNGSLAVIGNTTLTGNVAVSGGTATFGGATSIAGSFSLSGGTAQFDGATTLANVNISGAGVNPIIILNGLTSITGTLNMSAATFTPEIQGSGTTSVAGLFTWDGGVVKDNTMTLNGGLDITSAFGSSLIDGASITLAAGQTGNVSDSVVISNNGSFINQGTLTINDSIGDFSSSDDTGTFDNQATGTILFGGTSGFVDIGGGTGLNIITSGTIDAGDGTINLDSSNTVQWNGGRWTAGAGDINVIGALDIGGTAVKTLDGFTYLTSSGVNITGQGDLDIINGGDFIVGLAGPVSHTSDADIISSDSTGTFTVNAGGTFSKNNRSTEISTTFVNNGNVDISSNGTL